MFKTVEDRVPSSSTVKTVPKRAQINHKQIPMTSTERHDRHHVGPKPTTTSSPILRCEIAILSRTLDILPTVEFTLERFGGEPAPAERKHHQYLTRCACGTIVTYSGVSPLSGKVSLDLMSVVFRTLLSDASENSQVRFAELPLTLTTIELCFHVLVDVEVVFVGQCLVLSLGHRQVLALVDRVLAHRQIGIFLEPGSGVSV